jgi:hypothetical protein
MVEDLGWLGDMGFFGEHPERRHYARQLGDGTTCVVRLVPGPTPVFLRTYGLILNGDPEPEGEAACAVAWADLAGREGAERLPVSYGDVVLRQLEAEVCGDDDNG